MNIAFFETEDWEEQYLKEKLKGHNLMFAPTDLQINANLQIPTDNPPSPPLSKGGKEYSGAEVLCNFIGFEVNKQTLKHFPKLKFVATRSTGFDHIDIKACQEKGILVSNVPTYGENTVAEFAFALILALSRKLYSAVKLVREEGLFNTAGLQGFDLKGKTIGVVGAGHIGVHVIRIARGFDMKVLAYDPHPNKALALRYGFSYASLDELLKQSDIVTLHVPYLPATHHLINAEKFKLFKKGSLLINTARGGLVETESLVEALQKGILAGAGLDVLEEEGFVKDEVHMLFAGHPKERELRTVLADHELMKMPNVLITPHNAFNSREALIRILDTTIENILAFTKGTPINLVKA